MAWPEETPPGAPPSPAVVIDTNIALDLLLFANPAAQPLLAVLQHRQLRWRSTPRMREEFVRVLAYPHLAARLAWHGKTAPDLIAQRDAISHPTEAAPRCACICKDSDDQGFIDLAVAHQAVLLSKDAQVLKLRKRLAQTGVRVSPQWPLQEG